MKPTHLRKLLCTALIGCSQALGNDLDRLMALPLHELMQIPITGATLRAEAVARVPSAVTVFNHEALQNTSFDTLDELMNLVPGFQAYRSSGAALHHTFSSRGRRISPGSAEVLVLVDGLRYEISSIGGAAILAKYPLNFIERVEFIRGPGGALYGSNAMLGVINIVTRKKDRELQVGLGSNNKKQMSWLGSAEWQGWTFDAAALWQQDHGSLVEAPAENGDLFNTARDPYRKGTVNLNARRNSTELLLQFDHASEDNFYVTTTTASDENFGDFQTFNVALKQRFETTSTVSTLQLAYNRTDRKTGTQVLSEGALLPISVPASDAALVQHLDVSDQSQWQLRWHTEWKDHWSWGAEYRFTNNDSIEVYSNYDTQALFSGQLPIAYFNNIQSVGNITQAQRRDIIGAYLQHQRSLLSDALHLTLGGRFDHFASIGEQLSPRLGLTYDIADHHHVKLLYGEAFRAPTDLELTSRNNPLLAGNLSLDPENVQTWELIWLGRWSNLNLHVGYFESRFENAIVQAFEPTLGLDQYQNADQDPTKGWELEAHWQLSPRWRLHSTYTHFADKPALSFKEADTLGSLSLTFEQGKWQGTLSSIYTSERKTHPDATLSQIEIDDYWLIHFNSLYRPHPDLDLHLKVKNLLDVDYTAPADAAATVKLIPGRGREWQVGLTWRY